MLDLVAIFAALMPNERASIAAKLKQISYEKGDTVVEPGTVLQSLFIVGNGVLSVTKRGKSGETELLRFGPGDVFGEIGLLTGASCGASVTALAPSTVYELAKRELPPFWRQDHRLPKSLVVRLLSSKMLVVRSPSLSATRARRREG